MSSSVVALQPHPKVASLSELDNGSPLCTHPPNHTIQSRILAKMSSALISIPSEFQEDVLKRFLDDVIAVRRYAVLPSAPEDDLTRLCAEVKCSLNILPPEMRLKIFKLVLSDQWEGKVPALIKALRPVNKLYQEAITMFFTRSKRFRLHQGNDWKFGNMSDKVLSSIGRISIYLNDGRDDPRLPNNPTPDLSHLRIVFPKCEKVRFVCIRVPWGINGFFPLLQDDYITRLLVGFKKLYQICFRFPNTTMSQQLLGCLRPSSAGGIIERTNSLLGTTAKTRDIYVFPSVPSPVMLTTLYRGNPEDSTHQAYTFAYIEDEDRDGWIMYQPLPSMETWQWKAAKGRYLKEII